MKAPVIRHDEALVLFAGYLAGDEILWLRLDAKTGAVVERGTGAPGQFAGTDPDRVTLVVSAAEAQIKRLPIPARSEAQARAAAAHLFRGALASTPEATHFAVGEAQDGEGRRLVSAIASERLQAWIDACTRLGVAPGSAVLDCLIWPSAPGVVDVVEAAPLTIAAGGALGGFAIETPLAPAVFQRWLSAADGAFASINLCVGDVSAWVQALAAPGPHVQRNRVEDPLAVLARAAIDPPAHAPDLLQGAFARGGEQASNPWRLWRFAAALALIAVAMQIGTLVIAGWRDERAADQVIELAERDFRAARPDIRRVDNLRVRVKGLLNAQESAANHPVLAATNPLIAMLERHPDVRLDEVRHTGPGRQVHARLSSMQPQALAAALLDLRQTGATFEARELRPLLGRHTTEVVLETR